MGLTSGHEPIVDSIRAHVLDMDERTNLVNKKFDSAFRGLLTDIWGSFNAFHEGQADLKEFPHPERLEHLN